MYKHFDIFHVSLLSFADVGEIYSRLLDHRPVIQGELRYFIKEFEVGLLSFALKFFLNNESVLNFAIIMTSIVT